MSSKAPKIPDIKPRDLGLKVLVERKDADDIEADIIAVHGIGAHPLKTWIYEEGDKKVNWLTEETMLPAACPRARILSFGYDSVWHGENPARQSIDNVAMKLLSGLVQKRKDCPHRPVIFVGHCFGGLVVQRAYTLANIHAHDYPNVHSSVTGLLSLGTPYQGASVDQSLHQMYRGIVEMKMRTETNLLDYLARDNDMLVNIVHDFTREISKRSSPPRVFCFYEQKRTEFGAIAGFKTDLEFIVSESAGTLNGHPKEGLPLDHFQVSRFGENEDGNYISVRTEIRRMVDESTKILEERGVGKLDGTAPSSSTIVIQQHASSGTVPFRREKNFVVRGGILEKIQEKFDKTGMVALCGGPGTGKTHVAVEYAHKFVDAYPGSHCHWVNAGSAEEFELSFKLIADSLHLRDTGKGTLESVRHRLRQESSGHWLVVLDGLDDLTNLKAAGEAYSGRPLHEFIPKRHFGRVLVTTRSKSVANHLLSKQKGDYVLDIPSLDEKDIAQLLLGRCTSDEAKVKAAVRVADELGRSPVALTLAYTCRHAVYKGASLSRFLSTIKSQPSTRESSKDLAGVLIAWQPLHDYLKTNHPEAAELMLLICCMDLQNVRTSFLAEGAGRDVEKQIKVLVRYGMVEPSTNRATLGVTAMIRQCVQEWLKHVDQKAAYEEKVLSWMCAAYPSPEEAEHDRCEDLHPSALAIVKLPLPAGVEGKRERAALLFKVAKYHLSLKQNEAALKLLEDCLRLREQDSDGDPSLIDAARKAIAEAKDRSASAPQQKINDAATTSAPESSWQSHYNRGLDYDKQGRHEQAQIDYSTAFEICTRASGATSPEALRILSSLAVTMHSLGHIEKAASILQYVAMQQQTVCGADHPETLVTRHNAAVMMEESGAVEAAGEELQRVLSARVRLLGQSNAATILTLDHLVQNYQRRGMIAEADALQEAMNQNQQILLKGSEDDTNTQLLLEGLL